MKFFLLITDFLLKHIYTNGKTKYDINIFRFFLKPKQTG